MRKHSKTLVLLNGILKTLSNIEKIDETLKNLMKNWRTFIEHWLKIDRNFDWIMKSNFVEIAVKSNQFRSKRRRWRKIGWKCVRKWNIENIACNFLKNVDKTLKKS